MSTSKHLSLLPALALSLALAPAFAAQQSGPKAPPTRAATCYIPKLSQVVSTPISAQDVCFGQKAQIQKGNVVGWYCIGCKVNETLVTGGCAPPCRTGYVRANKYFAKCCRSTSPGYQPPPPVIK
jgi:hypothetical protein